MRAKSRFRTTTDARTATRRAAVLGVGAALVLGACSGTGGDEATAGRVDPELAEEVGKAIASEQGSAATAAPAADAAGEASDAVAAAPGGDGPVGQAPPALQPIDIGRSIIFTATVSVEVDNVAVASDAAMQAIAGLGGFLYGQQASTEPVPTNVLTFKVAPKDFQAAVSRLGGIGKLRDQQVSSDDVTERVVDLESRVRAAEISVERLRNFLEQATDIENLTALERELLQRESDLESLRGQLRTIEAQVDLATITLTITQTAPDGPAAELTTTAYAGGDGAVACPGDDELRLVEGEPMTVCYELVNTGSLALSEIRVDDPGLDLDPDDLEVIQGDLDAPLAPDETLVLAVTVDAALSERPAPRLRAVALDADGDPLRVQIATEISNVELVVDQDTSLPGFVDSLKGGLAVLATIGSVLVMLAGVLVPFIWIVPLVYLTLRWWRPRAAARRERSAAARLAARGAPYGAAHGAQGWVQAGQGQAPGAGAVPPGAPGSSAPFAPGAAPGAPAAPVALAERPAPDATAPDATAPGAEGERPPA